MPFGSGCGNRRRFGPDPVTASAPRAKRGGADTAAEKLVLKSGKGSARGKGKLPARAAAKRKAKPGSARKPAAKVGRRR